MKNFIIAVSVLLCCSLGFSQAIKSISQQPTLTSAIHLGGAQAAMKGPFSSADCAFTFSTGTNLKFLKYCVTANGNVTVFETPAGEEHLAVGKDGEGYGVCDSGVAYFDYAEFGDSGNWQAATVLSQTAKTVKIARTTNDGVWTLTQMFSQMTGPAPSLKIAMALKNNTAIDRTINFMRYANVDASGVPKNNLDATEESTFGWNSASSDDSPFGLVLQNFGQSPFESHFGLIQNVPDGPSPCFPFTNQVAGPLTKTDGSLFMFYGGSVPARKTKTVTLVYKGF